MPERIARDGGSIIPFVPTSDDAVSSPERPGILHLYYVAGVGLRAKTFGSTDPTNLIDLLAAVDAALGSFDVPMSQVVSQVVDLVVPGEAAPRIEASQSGIAFGNGTDAVDATLQRNSSGELEVVSVTGTHSIAKPGGITLLSGSADPTAGGGVVATIPALYVRTSDGTLWSKTGAGATQWTKQT